MASNNEALVGALVVTHGRLGDELLSAAEMIVGEVGHMAAVSIGWHDDVENSTLEIEEAIERVDAGRGIIILTDMFGGTPSNLSLSLLGREELEIVTGVNLPMIIKVATQKGGESVTELAKTVEEQGRKQIALTSKLLEQ